MRHIRGFFVALSQLLREGETQSLEFVIGLVSVLFGVQLLLALVTDAPVSLLSILPYPLVVLMGAALAVGGVGKVYGAVLDHETLRRYSALTLATIWLGVMMTNLYRFSATSLLFFLILAAQSAWVYIRLSILRKRADAS